MASPEQDLLAYVGGTYSKICEVSEKISANRSDASDLWITCRLIRIACRIFVAICYLGLYAACLAGGYILGLGQEFDSVGGGIFLGFFVAAVCNALLYFYSHKDES